MNPKYSSLNSKYASASFCGSGIQPWLAGFLSLRVFYKAISKVLARVTVISRTN